AGIFTTARDLGKFARAVMRRERGAPAGIMSRASVDLMWSREWQDGGGESGLGWGRSGSGYMNGIDDRDVVGPTGFSGVSLVTGFAAYPALAQGDRAGDAFWKSVQATCNAAAAKPAGELGRRIAQTAIDEFTRFGGHKIDSDGRIFHFGLTEAEHEEDDGGNP